MRTRRTGLGVAVTLVLAWGCYGDHDRSDDGGPTPEEDAGDLLDGGIAPDPCTTVCEPPRLLARVPLDLTLFRVPAVLDAVVHRDELVVSMLIGAPDTESSNEFSLARISRRTGEARIEVLDAPTWTASIGAAALVSHGETLSLISVYEARAFLPYVEPKVRITTWNGAEPTPASVERALTEEPLARCGICSRRGASMAIGVDGGLVVVADEGVLHVGRVGLEGATLVRDAIPVPGVIPNTALDACADRSGSGVLAIGGLREVVGATGTAALAMVATESGLEPPISVPGASGDSVPHPWLHDGALEIVRFQHDDGSSSGRLHRYALEGSETLEVGTIETAGELPPLAIASTPSLLVWVESSLTAIGESDLRVLAPPPSSTCERVSPASVIHLPRTLAGWNTRVMVATEADGRTYVALLEQELRSPETAVLVVFDLGACRDST